MTARASSTWEHVCSTCRALVLRAPLEAIAEQPRCSSCARIICHRCELGGRCGPCVDETLCVVDHVSEIGVRPWFQTQPDGGDRCT